MRQLTMTIPTKPPSAEPRPMTTAEESSCLGIVEVIVQ